MRIRLKATGLIAGAGAIYLAAAVTMVAVHAQQSSKLTMQPTSLKALPVPEPPNLADFVVDKQAAIVLLRTDALNMTPMHDLVGCAVMQASTANVDTVMIAGRVVKRDGKLLAPGLADKLATLQRSGKRIISDFNALPRRAS